MKFFLFLLIHCERLKQKPEIYRPTTLDSSVIDTMSACTSSSSYTKFSVVCQLGAGGVGYIWSICEGGYEEEWRHSVAPIPADKLAEISQAVDDDQELLTQDGAALSPSGELKSDSNASEGDIEDIKDDSAIFEKEVNST